MPRCSAKLGIFVFNLSRVELSELLRIAEVTERERVLLVLANELDGHRVVNLPKDWWNNRHDQNRKKLEPAYLINTRCDE